MPRKSKKAAKKSRFVKLNTRDWDRRRLKSLLADIAGKRILVIGDVGVDRYTIGSVERISPEAPVPIVLVQQEVFKLGLAANVADNVKALGGVPLLTGVVGGDRTAEDFCKLLEQTGIASSHLVVDRNRRTVLKERIVSDRQQLLRVDYETLMDIDSAVEAKLLAKVKTLLAKCDAVILEDYAKGTLKGGLAEGVFAAAGKHKKIVAVDPNSKSELALYRGATVLTPNTKEAEALSGISIRDEISLMKAGQHILTETRADHVVITRGGEGMAIFTAGDSSCHLIPTYAQEVYDVSGAGDTVISVFTLAMSAGATASEAAVLGNLAAGVEVGKRGTATVSVEEILAAMEFHGSGGG